MEPLLVLMQNEQAGQDSTEKEQDFLERMENRVPIVKDKKF